MPLASTLVTLLGTCTEVETFGGMETMALLLAVIPPVPAVPLPPGLMTPMARFAPLATTVPPL